MHAGYIAEVQTETEMFGEIWLFVLFAFFAVIGKMRGEGRDYHVIVRSKWLNAESCHLLDPPYCDDRFPAYVSWQLSINALLRTGFSSIP